VSKLQAGAIGDYSELEVCRVVPFLQAEGLSQSKIHGTLVSVYDQNVFRQTKTLHVDENCVTVEGLIREDRSVKVHEIAEVASTTKNTLHEIICDILHIPWKGTQP
jgi:hypothetical protein